MFELEQAIEVWRRDFAAAWPRRADLDELEDHLREEFAVQVRAGHAPDAAWTRAQSRLGAPAQVAREFSRSAELSTLDRAVFGVLMAAVALAAVGATLLVATRAPQVAFGVLASHIVTITVGYVTGLAVAALGAYVAVKNYFAAAPASRLSTVAVRWVRLGSLAAAGLTVAGIVLGSVWFNVAKGGPLLRDPREWGALAVAICFLATWASCRRRATAPAALFPLAIAGGGLVLAAWLAALPESAGGRPLFQAVGFGGLAASLVLAALALKFRRPPVVAN